MVTPNAFKKIMNTLAFNKFNLPNKNDDNSDILKINIEHSPGVILQLPLKRYDDILNITKNFFLENDLPELLLKPVVYKICEAMRSIYTMFNIKLKKIDRDYLFSLRLIYIRLKQEEVQEDSVIKNNFEEDEELNISSISAISDTDDLPFFKLNKSY
jgi:hypothetical protein